ncbi:MAG: TlpA family protein disulfide reductase [Phycisphaeraceae bacterium]|nr:TlpA family protein disulfide reductase [Phycisphaeraceae bacterium]
MRHRNTLIPAMALALLAGAATLISAPHATAANNNAAPAIGAAAPAWTLKDPDGVEHSLADYRGKVVVLDFWATWCGPCKQAMPGVQKLHEDYKDRGVVVIGMNGSERGGDPAGYMKSKGFTYLLLLNSEEVMPDYGVRGIPAFFVIGADGKLAWQGSGSGEKTHKQLVQAVDLELKKIRS